MVGSGAGKCGEGQIVMRLVGVARGHQRANTLKPYSQKTSQSNHTRTTAFSNSMKMDGNG